MACPHGACSHGMTKKKKETETKQESDSNYPLIIHGGQCCEEELQCVTRVPGETVL